MPVTGYPIDAAKLADQRRRCRMTRSDLADAADCSASYISRLERGICRHVSMAMVAKLETALHVDAAALGINLPTAAAA